MRYFWGAVSLVAFFVSIMLVLLAISDGIHAAVIIVAAFVVLLISYFAYLVGRRYRQSK